MLILNLLRAYWKPLSIALILALGYLYISSLRSDNASLRADIVARDATAKQQVADNALKIKSAQIIADNAKASYEAEIKLRDLDRIKLKKGLENEKANITAMLATANKLRRDNPSRSGVSEIRPAASISSGDRSDSNTISIVVEACKLTTLDYNTLHKAWLDNCAIYGCE